MNYTPKNILKGRTSKGETFTIREWSFQEIATLETLSFLWLLILGLVAGSVAAPIFTIFAIIGFSGRFQITQLIAILSGVYFLIDCHMGWIALGALKIFFEERTINMFLVANGASVIVSSILMFFGGFFSNWITKPINHYDEATYKSLPRTTKVKYEKEIDSRKTNFMYLMIFLFIVNFFVVDSVIEREKGWTKNGILGIPALTEIQ
jgi:hypothetical protein